MKSPLDTVKGRVVDYDPQRQELTIKAHYADWPIMLKRGYKECEVRLIDDRRLSEKQRNSVYALLKEISKHTGQGLSSTKEAMKRKFLDEDMCETGMETFSMADAPVSLVCAFQSYLVRFILDYDIPCSFPLLDFVDDVQDYVYACLVSKKCCICGKPCDLHHVDHVGAGRDREDIVHEGMEVLPLCREHHTEVHAIGWLTFQKKHHLSKGIVLDAHLCKLYRLKRKEEIEDAEQDYPDGAVDPRP